MSRQWQEQDFFAPTGKSIRSVSGQELADRGIVHVAANNDQWLSRGLINLRHFLTVKPEFTIEDFRAEWIRFDIQEPTHANAWGALARVAAQQGLIVKTGAYVPAKEPSAHGRMIAVWKRK